MARNIGWTRDQLLIAFRLYCRTPFGRLHRLNPEIVQLAPQIGRTPDALAMKACNFASLDPAQKARKIKALGNTSAADRELWTAFEMDSSAVAAEAEAAFERLPRVPAVAADLRPAEPSIPEGPTEVQRLVRARRVQGFFREAVLSSYDFRCALTGLAIPSLLNASHIIPWSDSERRRADPRNGLCLNALHDRAFDRGLLTFDEAWRAVISPKLQTDEPLAFHRQSLLELEGVKLRLPPRFQPDPEAMAFHRERVFSSALA